jgi:hypothetical protein
MPKVKLNEIVTITQTAVKKAEAERRRSEKAVADARIHKALLEMDDLIRTAARDGKTSARVCFMPHGHAEAALIKFRAAYPGFVFKKKEVAVALKTASPDIIVSWAAAAKSVEKKSVRKSARQ